MRILNIVVRSLLKCGFKSYVRVLCTRQEGRGFTTCADAPVAPHSALRLILIKFQIPFTKPKYIRLTSMFQGFQKCIA